METFTAFALFQTTEINNKARRTNRVKFTFAVTYLITNECADNKEFIVSNKCFDIDHKIKIK